MCKSLLEVCRNWRSIAGFHTGFFSGGGGGHTRLFDHTLFCWNHTHLIKIVSGLELVTSIGKLMRFAIERPQLTEVNLHQILKVLNYFSLSLSTCRSSCLCKRRMARRLIPQRCLCRDRAQFLGTKWVADLQQPLTPPLTPPPMEQRRLQFPVAVVIILIVATARTRPPRQRPRLLHEVNIKL